MARAVLPGKFLLQPMDWGRYRFLTGSSSIPLHKSYSQDLKTTKEAGGEGSCRWAGIAGQQVSFLLSHAFSSVHAVTLPLISRFAVAATAEQAGFLQATTACQCNSSASSPELARVQQSAGHLKRCPGPRSGVSGSSPAL